MEEKIDFDDLKNIMNITDEYSFQLYIDDIYTELKSKKTGEEEEGIDKKVFLKFLKLPVFMGEKIFNSICDSKFKIIAKEVFKNFLLELYLGDFATVARLIFNIYDFNKDGSIAINDIKHLLGFLPLKKKEEGDKLVEYKYQLDSLFTLETELREQFKNRDKMNFDEYLDSIKKNSTFFLQLLCYLYINLPVTSNALWIYEKVSKNNTSSNLRKLTQKSDSSDSNYNNSYASRSPRLNIVSQANLSPLQDFMSRNDNATSRIRLQLKKARTRLEVTKLFTHDIRKSSHKLFRSPKQKLSTIDKTIKINAKSSFYVDPENLKKAENEKFSNFFKQNISHKIGKNTFLKESRRIIEGDLKTFPLRDVNNKEEESKEIKLDSQTYSNIQSPIFNFEDEDYTQLSELNIQPYNPYRYESSKSIIKDKSVILEVNEDEDMERLMTCKKSKSLQCIQIENELAVMENDNKLRHAKGFGNNKKRSEMLQIRNKLRTNSIECQEEKDSCLTIVHSKNEESETEEVDNYKIIEDLNNQLLLEESQQRSRVVLMEGELLKFKRKKLSFKPFYAKIIDHNIYYYKTKEDLEENYKKMHYLQGSFVSKIEPQLFQSQTYYGIKIDFSNGKQKKYFHINQEEINQWINNLNIASNYKDFFDFYKVGDFLGQGQFGIVKAAFVKKTGEKVAVKIFEKSKISMAVTDMQNEIDIMKHSKHKNIVQFYDFFENQKYIFIVMELVTYGNLYEYIQLQKVLISEINAARIIFQIFEGLSYLKAFGIIHRDIKPNNIMLSSSPKSDYITIKITDFGLSKVISPQERAIERCGTISYIAPEILEGSGYNEKVDIWSVGVIAYYILSNELPFDASSDSLTDICKEILSKKLSFSHKFEKRSMESRDLIRKCLIKDSEKRISIEDALLHPWFKIIK